MTDLNRGNIASIIADFGEFAEPPEWADIIPLSEFIQSVKLGYFIDYDGFGHLVFRGQEVRNSWTHLDIDPPSIVLGKVIFTLEDIENELGDTVSITWYNR